MIAHRTRTGIMNVKLTKTETRCIERAKELIADYGRLADNDVAVEVASDMATLLKSIDEKGNPLPLPDQIGA